MKNLNLSKLKYRFYSIIRTNLKKQDESIQQGVPDFHLKIYMIKATNRTSKNILMNNAREEIKKIKKIVMNRIDK